jgi:pseudouridine-5'-phosphate glycosidase
LAKIKELTGDESIVANRALIESNVIMGTNVAKALCQIQAGEAANSK